VTGELRSTIRSSSNLTPNFRYGTLSAIQARLSSGVNLPGPLKGARITVAAHFRTSGLADALAQHLVPIADEVLLIHHTLIHEGPASSSYQIY
jgi:hypothetical protein